MKKIFLITGIALAICAPVWASSGSASLFHDITLPFIGIFLAAKIGGILCEKIGLPALVGEILGGVMLGNLALFGLDDGIKRTILTSPFFIYAAELGVVFLLFQVGLESNFVSLVRAGFNSFVTAIIGVVVPTLSGFTIVALLGLGDTSLGLLIGATFAATSVGITAKLFSEYKKLQTPSAQIVLGAAVVDDVIGLILLAAITTMAAGGAISAAVLAGILGKVLAFFAVSLLFGHYLLPQLVRTYRFLEQPGIVTVLAVLMALIFADIAYLVELASIVGAFMAGLLLDEVKLRHAPNLTVHHIEDVIKPLTDFLLPVFFVSIGLQVDLLTFADAQAIGLILALLIVAILGKAVCGMACRGSGLDRVGIGLGMIPRGEVGLIFAQTGLAAGLVNQHMYSILVLVVLLTTIVGPMLLKTRIRKF